MQDQIWFFGRASRNILDQHVTAGLLIKKMGAKRVLVGDAGALMYASDRPGLDLIGLGGYHDYPFARSTRHGLGSSLELIERIPVDERPDLLAIYPSWWGDLPTYFGQFLTSVPVRGNVICGGAEKVLYRADWSAMDRRGLPKDLQSNEVVRDALDTAELLSERAHDYRLPGPSVGFVTYRVLGHPRQPRRGLFDAGRIVPQGIEERARLRAPRQGGRLVVRLAPEHPVTIDVRVEGAPLTELRAEPADGVWVELSTPLPDSLSDTFELGLTPKGGASTHFHVWVVERAD
jgi:hypothetical protein